MLSVSLGHCLRAGRRARARHPGAGRHRQRQGEGRRARPRARRGGAGKARHLGAALSRPRRGDQAAYAVPKGPTVVADPSDNAGGGAASDNTNVIRRLIERGLSDAGVGPLWDPVAVQFCHAAGVGTTLPLRFGGKTAITSGAPIDAEARSSAVKRDGRQTFGIAKVTFGDARRHPRRRRRGGADLAPDAGARARDLQRCRHRSVRPNAIIGVKSTNHFHAAYARSPPGALLPTATAPRRSIRASTPTRRPAAPSGRTRNCPRGGWSC